MPRHREPLLGLEGRHGAGIHVRFEVHTFDVRVPTTTKKKGVCVCVLCSGSVEIWTKKGGRVESLGGVLEWVILAGMFHWLPSMYYDAYSL